MKEDYISLAHGSGGKQMRKLIERLTKKYFANPILMKMNDFAQIKGADNMVVSTDSFVIKPYKFPGGDIGKLAICGTVNDVACSGAEVLYITLAFIIEEGFSIIELENICKSIKEASREAGVIIISGDTKVVENGAADGIYINTTGIGIKHIHKNIGGEFVKHGDKIIINGNIGDHAAAILSCREGLSFTTATISDCAPLNMMVKELLDEYIDIRCMRDPTRGGVATVLNEIAKQSNVGIRIYEKDLPIEQSVVGACELFGMDPLYMANEGKILFFVAAEEADKAVRIMRKNKYGTNAAIIGEVIKSSRQDVIMKTIIGSSRIIDELTGEILPRIC